MSKTNKFLKADQCLASFFVGNDDYDIEEEGEASDDDLSLALQSSESEIENESSSEESDEEENTENLITQSISSLSINEGSSLGVRSGVAASSYSSTSTRGSSKRGASMLESETEPARKSPRLPRTEKLSTKSPGKTSKGTKRVIHSNDPLNVTSTNSSFSTKVIGKI